MDVATFEELLWNSEVPSGELVDAGREWTVPIPAQADLAGELVTVDRSQTTTTLKCQRCSAFLGAVVASDVGRVWLGTWRGIGSTPSFRYLQLLAKHRLGRRTRQKADEYAVFLDRSDAPTRLLVHCAGCGRSAMVDVRTVSEPGTVRVPVHP